MWAESKIYDSLKLYEKGVRNEQQWQFFIDNTRTELRGGDTEAMIAAGRLGATLPRAARQVRPRNVMQAVDEFLDYCERMMRAQIEQVPDGSRWRRRLSRRRRPQPRPAAVREGEGHVEGDEITIDLSESCDNVPTGFNVPFGGSVLPGIYTVIRSVFLDEATFTDFIPQNDGIFRPINVIAREGSIFNPTFPRSALSRVCPIMRASDCAILALSEVVPDQVCAGCSAVGVGVYTGYIPEQEEYWVHIEINEGAYGGRSGKDGLDAIDVLTVNSRNTPIEETDWLFPLHTVRYEMRDDLEPAPGQWRGGLGIVRKNRFLEPGVYSCEGDRHSDPPRGIYGGYDGLPGKSTFIDKDGNERDIPAKVTGFLCGAGEIIQLTEPNSGGYGNPLDREPRMVREDVLDDFTTIELAKEAYGVVISERLEIDEAATKALRTRLRGERGADFQGELLTLVSTPHPLAISPYAKAT